MTENRENESHILTVAEIAKRLRVSKMTIYRAVHSGEITAYRVGRSFRIHPEDADTWMNKNKVKP